MKSSTTPLPLSELLHTVTKMLRWTRRVKAWQRWMMNHHISSSSRTAMLALNQIHQVETSSLDENALDQMLGAAFYADCAGEGEDGFIIAFDQDGDYDSSNFLWFKARYDRFAYVDRIIVADHARGRGLARTFYTNLFEYARKAGHARIVCEINVEPPNPGSMAFHLALGFVELAQMRLSNGKIVSYQECVL